MQLNDEFLERDRVREDEVAKFKAALEDAAGQRQRQLELDMARRRQENEEAMLARAAKLQDALVEKDKMREEEAAAFKQDLDRKYPFTTFAQGARKTRKINCTRIVLTLA